MPFVVCRRRSWKHEPMDLESLLLLQLKAMRCKETYLYVHVHSVTKFA